MALGVGGKRSFRAPVDGDGRQQRRQAGHPPARRRCASGGGRCGALGLRARLLAQDHAEGACCDRFAC